MQKIAHLLFGTAAAVMAVVGVSASTVVFLARGKSSIELAHNSLTRAVVRSFRFCRSMPNRDARCSSGETWRLSNDFATEEDIRASLTVLRAEGPYSLVRSSFGNFWMPSRDIQAFPEMLVDAHKNIYQSSDIAINAGDTVLDCGANVGVYTRYALSKGARCVVAIELAPEDIACLRRTFAAEISTGSVIVYPKGVWDTDVTRQLQTSSSLSSMANTVAGALDEKGPLVPLTTIDKIVAELQLDRIDFIKMDIEGAEANALRGAFRTLKHFHPKLAIALEHHPSDPDSLPALVRRNWPTYTTQLSACAIVGADSRVQPNVMYASAR